MSAPLAANEAPAAPLSGELRYGLELARLLADRDFHRPARSRNARAVLLIPGFMAGDGSLSVMAGWLRRRGSRVAGAGMLLNTDCAERAVERLEGRLRRLSSRAGERVVVIGQSRGGELGRVLALRNPDAVSTLVMLGSPVLGPLNVGPAVWSALRSVARLGDAGVPGMLSRECAVGECCASFRTDLRGRMPQSVRTVSVYSKSDPIVSYRSCLDPDAEQVEVSSSHTGMSVNVGVYRVIARVLAEEEAAERWAA
ncbi:MAG TPA: alpha/beta hydrolase [Solirubrobacteraceae bacterium]|jgi:pimeloyl-ACP methyl ester carboxylesterase|nr:alpha/beta hydrolase [Solirubrobacteraceae bacterium]